MKMFVIADEDTVLGFRYCGIDGQAVRTSDEARALLEKFVAEQARILIIMTDQVAGTLRERVNEIRFEQELPILVEIPGPDGPSPDRPALGRIIQQAVGIHV